MRISWLARSPPAAPSASRPPARKRLKPLPRREPGRAAAAPRKAAAKAEGVVRADDKTSREDWQRDALLRVRLPPADLARRLRDLMTDARTAREETGVPTLYLALGTLTWRDPATPETERRAPLALLPVTLEREGVSQTFRLRAGATEVAENLSLREMLKVNFTTALPDFDDATYNPTAWAEAVASAVKDRPDWSVDAGRAGARPVLLRQVPDVARPGAGGKPRPRRPPAGARPGGRGGAGDPADLPRRRRCG